MKYLCFLFFITAARAFEYEFKFRSQIEPTSMVPLGWVKDLNSDLPKCTGTFVTTSVMLTTAKCLFCNEKCNLVVRLGGDDKVKYNIKSMKIHEEYDIDPHKNDVGLVFIEGQVSDKAVVNLPSVKHNPSLFPVFFYKSKFSGDGLTINPEKISVLTNAKCTFALNSYIPESQICAFLNANHALKESDQGSPLMYSYSGKMHVVGMYSPGSSKAEKEGKMIIYESIVPYVSWIERHAKNKTQTQLCFSSRSDAGMDMLSYTDNTKNSEEMA